MKINNSWYPASYLTLIVGIISAGFGLILGILAGLQPLLLSLAVFTVIFVICFFTYFEQSVLGLLILRSSLDIFSAQQIPAAFAIGLDALTIMYVLLMLLTGQRIQTDKFWWFFAGWVGLQGFWIVLMLLGGLGLDASHLAVSIREFVRLFSWLVVYLLVMQLRGKISPQRFINILMISLIAPLIIAFIQVILPEGVLPSMLVYAQDEEVIGEGSRIFGTLGHPNGFAKFLFLFIALTWWQIDRFGKRWYWLLLMCTLIFLLVATQALFAIGMFGVFIIVRVAQKISLSRFIGGVIVFVLFMVLFSSTELGVERLNSITNTPLLNPDIDISQAILSSDGNSFNWRIAQWTYLLQAWAKYPIFGYGLQGSSEIPIYFNYAHNDYVRALVEGGVVGFATFLIFLGGQFVRIMNLYLKSTPRSDARRLHSILLSVFLSFLLGMTTDNVWSNTVVYFYWWSILAVAGWDWNEADKNTAVNHYHHQENFLTIYK